MKTTLDIIYNYDSTPFNTYRISISGIDKINTIMNMLYNRKNHIIFSILVSKINNKEKDIEIIKKMKDPNNTFNINEYDIRVRLSEELSLSDKEKKSLLKIEDEERFNISFRFKQRVSLEILKNKDIKINLDVTNVKHSESINNINSSPSSYEIELEILKMNKDVKSTKKYLKIIEDEIYLLKKVLQQNDFIISKDESDNTLEKYKRLIFKSDNANLKNLYGMNSQSVEIQHIVDNIPNKYTVTDKADGDRHMLYVVNNKIYYISSNLEVKYSGRELKGKKTQYNETLIDGEYIYLKKYNKYLFLCFDILFHKGKDVRNNIELKERFEYLDDFCNAIKSIKNEGYENLTTHSPCPRHEISYALNEKQSRVPFFI
jgi:hypothetical protein